MVENKSRNLSAAQRVALPEKYLHELYRGKNDVERVVDTLPLRTVVIDNGHKRSD